MLKLFQDCHPTPSWHFMNCVLLYSKMKLTHTEAHVRVGVEVNVQMLLVSIQLERQADWVLWLPNSLFVHIKKTHFEMATCSLLPTFLFSVVCCRESRIKASPKQSFCARYRRVSTGGSGLWKSFLLRVPEKSERAKSIFYSHTLDHC